MASLLLIEGPAGSGKSQEVARMLAAGEADVVADLTALWAALRGVERDPETGRYPIREDDDPAVRGGLAGYVRAAVVRQALRDDLAVVVTSGSPDMATKWAAVAEESGAAFAVRTVDPGEAVVRQRLAVDGALDPQCEKAVRRWYRR